MKILAALCLAFLLVACSAGDAVRVARIVTTGDVAGAERMAAEKAVRYAANPAALTFDLKQFKKRLVDFRRAVGTVWGEKEREEPTPKKYVKYTRNYLSRAEVDFDQGLITVETLEQKDPSATLKTAVVTTLLTPDDPRAVDLYSAVEVKLGGLPFLYKEVLDHQGHPLRWTWRAERFADQLLRDSLQTRTVSTPDGDKTARFVTIPMVKDHLHVRARKYQSLVTDNARRFKVSGNLIYAVMKTESDFNPFAISSAPAFGLMQVVPGTAGSDVYRFLHGKQGRPSRDLLLTPKHNIQYGTAYLHILDDRYLAAIQDPISRLYCSIAAYNGGAGNVLRTFHKDKKEAVRRINALPPGQVYKILREKLPHAETRRYLWKVTQAQKEFVNF